ncbi:hypothetical protein [Thiocapsa bogorovii]|uniref:hypothetical protein n=1 Tax=Thiocapsa bogorovii TaxID=521689 RepID=UPI001E308371|nr:hypothetical protein [Thiocapsa bogorovii]UHD17893.1 hypothetical protein LT988_07555 [Thiocapsa bogorovii]
MRAGVAYERGRFYREERQAVPNPQGSNQHGEVKGNKSQKPCPQPTTAETIGARYNVSPRTVKNDAKYAEAVETLLSEHAPRTPIFEASKAVVVKAATDTHAAALLGSIEAVVGFPHDHYPSGGQ